MIKVWNVLNISSHHNRTAPMAIHCTICGYSYGKFKSGLCPVCMRQKLLLPSIYSPFSPPSSQKNFNSQVLCSQHLLHFDQYLNYWLGWALIPTHPMNHMTRSPQVTTRSRQIVMTILFWALALVWHIVNQVGLAIQDRLDTYFSFLVTHTLLVVETLLRPLIYWWSMQLSLVSA